MKHKIKPVGIMKAVSLYADGTSMFLHVTGSVDWNSDKCNKALSRMAAMKSHIEKGTYNIPRAPRLPHTVSGRS